MSELDGSNNEKVETPSTLESTEEKKANDGGKASEESLDDLKKESEQSKLEDHNDAAETTEADKQNDPNEPDSSIEADQSFQKDDTEPTLNKSEETSLEEQNTSIKQQENEDAEKDPVAADEEAPTLKHSEIETDNDDANMPEDSPEDYYDASGTESLDAKEKSDENIPQSEDGINDGGDQYNADDPDDKQSDSEGEQDSKDSEVVDQPDEDIDDQDDNYQGKPEDYSDEDELETPKTNAAETDENRSGETQPNNGENNKHNFEADPEAEKDDNVSRTKNDVSSENSDTRTENENCGHLEDSDSKIDVRSEGSQKEDKIDNQQEASLEESSKTDQPDTATNDENNVDIDQNAKDESHQLERNSKLEDVTTTDQNGKETSDDQDDIDLKHDDVSALGTPEDYSDEEASDSNKGIAKENVAADGKQPLSSNNGEAEQSKEKLEAKEHGQQEENEEESKNISFKKNYQDNELNNQNNADDAHTEKEATTEDKYSEIKSSSESNEQVSHDNNSNVKETKSFEREKDSTSWNKKDQIEDVENINPDDLHKTQEIVQYDLQKDDSVEKVKDHQNLGKTLDIKAATSLSTQNVEKNAEATENDKTIDNAIEHSEREQNSFSDDRNVILTSHERNDDRSIWKNDKLPEKEDVAKDKNNELIDPVTAEGNKRTNQLPLENSDSNNDIKERGRDIPGITNKVDDETTITLHDDGTTTLKTITPPDGVVDDAKVSVDPDYPIVVHGNVSYEQGHNEIGALGTCGVTSVSNALNLVTGKNIYTESETLDHAVKNNECEIHGPRDVIGGTSTNDVVKLINEVKNPDDHIHTEVYENGNALKVETLAERLKEDGTVAIVGVDSATLWDEHGDVCNNGILGEQVEGISSPSDHWITVESPVYSTDGKLLGFNIIDSGGGESYISTEKFKQIYLGSESHQISDPTAIIVSNHGESLSYQSGNDVAAQRKTSKLDNAENNYEKELIKKFNADNFKEQDSFDTKLSRNTNNYQQILDIKNKCVNRTITLDEQEKMRRKITIEDINSPMNKKDASYTTDEISKLREIRDQVEPPTENTVMQKVLCPASGKSKENIEKDLSEFYLHPKNDKAMVGGFVAKASDAAPYCGDPVSCCENLRLDYKDSPYVPANVDSNINIDNGIYIMRFTMNSEDLDDITVPYSKEFDPDNGEDFPQPCTGNGFTGSDKYMIPEYRLDSYYSPTAAVIYRLDKNGHETPVAIFHGQKFELI